MHTMIRSTLDFAFTSIVRQWGEPPAVVAALFDTAGPIWTRCHGEQVDEHTIFALASGTKTFAAASVAQLCDSNVLTWDTRMIDIDPAFDAGDARVTNELTLRDLACHRTGWTSSEGRHRAAAMSRADLVRRLRFHGFRHPFRETFAYCTDGFSALGYAVDVTSSQTWEQRANAHLLQPLRMNRTTFTVAEAQAAGNAAQPHLRMPDGTFAQIPWTYEDGVATPAGGANSCLADIGRWLNTWLGVDTPWSETQRLAMLTEQIDNAGPFRDEEFSRAVPLSPSGISDKAYCLGWYAHRYAGESVRHHTGSIRGFRSIIALLPERRLGFACLTNADCVYLPRALFQATLDALQDRNPLTWTTRFLERDLIARSQAPRYSREIPDNGSRRGLAGVEGVYEDDGRFGRVTLESRGHCLALSAGKLHLLVASSGVDDELRCFEPCGELYIDRGAVSIVRGSHGIAKQMVLLGAEFRRGDC